VNKITSTRIQLFLNMRHNSTSWDLLALLNFTYGIRCLFVIQIIFPRMVGNTVYVCENGLLKLNAAGVTLYTFVIEIA